MKDYLNGFQIGYEAILEHKQLFEKFLLELESKKIETRIIFRTTKIYGTILGESFHIDYLKNKESRDVLFNSMYNAEHTGIPYKIISSEIEQLKNYDIPAFKKTIGINQVFTFSDQSLNISYDNETDIEQVKKRLSNMRKTTMKFEKNAIHFIKSDIIENNFLIKNYTCK